jgi:hypothetical protein
MAPLVVARFSSPPSYFAHSLPPFVRVGPCWSHLTLPCLCGFDCNILLVLLLAFEWNFKQVTTLATSDSLQYNFGNLVFIIYYNIGNFGHHCFDHKSYIIATFKTTVTTLTFNYNSADV